MISLIEYLCERIKSSYEFNNYYNGLLEQLAHSFSRRISMILFLRHSTRGFYISVNFF